MRPRPHSHIAPGADLKFRVTPHIDDFLISEDPFVIIVRNQAGRVCYRIPRGDCFYDSEGRWYFGIEHVQEGLYEAVFMAGVEDDDYDKQRAVVTDRRLLCAVGRYTMPPRPSHEPPKPWVEYEQVWMVSVDGADYLSDCDGKYVFTGDGLRIQFSNDVSEVVEDMGKVKMKMEGKEFLKKWEGTDPNGVIDTVPEMEAAMRGISDEETIPEHTDEQIEDKLEEEAATNDDIDEMFS